MSTATANRSAYPREVADLIPHARDLAASLGELPSRNKLMTTFKVGAPKAKELLAALTTAPADPPTLPAEPEPTPDPLPELPEPTGEHAEPESTDVEPDPAPAAPAVPDTPAAAVRPERSPVTWPVLLLCLPAFVAIWGGWVEMGRLTGFGKVTLLPGISDFQLNTAITLPIGVETYAAYALFVWLSGRAAGDARRFAKRSAIASLIVGALGQIAYHLMNAAGWTSAPWWITAIVSCIPVAVLGMGAALAHLMHKH
ncbi:hypothetical protein [Actinoplanes subtropicus]|uniref:hypothetical protein n=1 Tax=Actinoplanes subtropicus TaxID=543632 RepID=UPI0004C30D4F|nr:hypothetical protein [Actinoplanes subtropicus]